MPLLVQGVSRGVDSFAGLLVLLAQRRALDTLGNSGTPSRDIPGMLPEFDRDPWAWGHYSFVWGHLMSSIASVGDDLVPSGRRIGCSRNRMDGFALCFEMDSSVHGPSI